MLRAIVMAGALVVATSAMAQGRLGPGEMLEQADTNKDGMIDKDEFKAARAAQFAKMDRNGDGFLDAQDRQQPAESQGENGRKFRGGGERGARMMGQLDTNGDGKISKDEFVNAPTTFFDRADTDKDGVLSAKEIEAAKAAARARFSERRKHGAEQPSAQQPSTQQP